MKIVDLAIRRPVTITMLVAGLVLLGILSWRQMPQDLYPALNYPQLTVLTRYANAAPEEIETLVTRPVEEAVATTRHLKSLRSLSREGLSLVTAQFHWGVSVDFAALEMREKLDLIQEELPRDCEDPVVKKINPFALPLLILSLSAEKEEDPLELRRFAETQLKECLQKVPGVASVVLNGGRQKEIFVEVDPDRLRRRSLDLLKVIRAVKDANVNYPAGSAKEAFYEVVVRTLGEFKNATEIENIVVDQPRKGPEPRSGRGDEERQEERSLVYLRDIADVREGFKEKESLSRFNGRENISCFVYPQAQSNPVKTAQLVREALKEIAPFMPKKMKMDLIYDKAAFIEQSVSGVRSAALQGGCLAFLVLLLFLAKPRSALIVAVSIPVSIAATFLLMFLKGISINMISLGGLALGIGMLLDNAIVIIENISRHRALGAGWVEAARRGTSEVSAPITASTLTSVAVFLPMVFLNGIEGQLFQDLALTVIFAQLTSLGVALILLPRWAAHQKDRAQGSMPGLEKWTEFQIGRLKQFYVGFLRKTIGAPRKVLTATAAAFAASLLIFFFLPKELLPKVDQGEFLVRLTLPAGMNLEATGQSARKIEEVLLQEPQVKSVALSVGSEQDAESESLRSQGSHQAQFVVLRRDDRRESTTARLVRRLRARVAAVQSADAQVEFFLQDQPFAGNLFGGGGIQIEVRGQDLVVMRSAVERLKKILGAAAQATQIQDSIPLASPEIRVQIDKNRIALYDLSSKEIALATQAAIKGVVATKIHEEGREVDVRVRLRPDNRQDLSSLNSIAVLSGLDEEIPLEELATLKKGEGPSVIERLDGSRVFFLTCQAGAGSQSKLEEKIERMLAREKFPEGIRVGLSGETQERRDSFGGLIWALALSILLVYMIMAAQFESLFEPFLILFTVPFSVIGVALALLVTGTPLSAMVFLGLILLGGIVVNNGIVLIEYIHDLRCEGKPLEVAVVEAGATRLRPILMTMLTSVLGLAPFLFGGGREVQIQTPMALTLAGGLAVSTLLTLLLLPLLYLQAEKMRLCHSKSASKIFKLTLH